MKKQTAVEWYSEQLARIGVTEELIGHLTKEAKEMEKYQIIECSFETTKDCWISLMENFGEKIKFSKQDLIVMKKEAEQYYNETFNT